MNGPTERELRIAQNRRDIRRSAMLRDWITSLPFGSGDRTGWHYIDTQAAARLDEAVEAWADRESAALRARVAVLEQQIAAIEALQVEYGHRAHEARSDMSWRTAARELRAVLAAGVVDNPTEGSPS